jgi:mycothiol system anti-sigma-R factor
MDEQRRCNDAAYELYTFLDGELTDEKRRDITQHLDDCPPCFEQFDFEAELRQVIASKCKDAVPDELRRRIADALGVEPSGPSEPSEPSATA